MAGYVFNNYKTIESEGAVNLESDTLKVILLTGYTFDIDGDVYYSDVIANEISATGYSAGGATLANVAVTTDNANDLSKFDADDATWAGLDGVTPGQAIILKWTGAAATSPLICGWDGLTTAADGTTYRLRFHSNGIWQKS